MDAQSSISSEEMSVLIHTTLSETVSELSANIDAYRLNHTTDQGRLTLSQIIDETRKFVVFLKYANEYMRKKLPQSQIREEMLRIKLHLLSILRALSDHVKAADHTAVYDLITEELRDNLTLWKINVLPLLRPQQSKAQSRSGSIHP